MGWLQRVFKRKLMALVVKYVIAYIDKIDEALIDELDKWVDNQIRQIIGPEWLEELALDLEQAVVDDVVKYFLPDIKQWVKDNIKLIIQNAQNPAALVKKMAEDIGDELAEPQELMVDSEGHELKNVSVLDEDLKPEQAEPDADDEPEPKQKKKGKKRN